MTSELLDLSIKQSSRDIAATCPEGVAFMPEGHTAMGVGGMVIPPEERFKMVGNASHMHTVASLMSEGRQQITARARMNHRGQKRQQQ